MQRLYFILVLVPEHIKAPEYDSYISSFIHRCPAKFLALCRTGCLDQISYLFATLALIFCSLANHLHVTTFQIQSFRPGIGQGPPTCAHFCDLSWQASQTDNTHLKIVSNDVLNIINYLQYFRIHQTILLPGGYYGYMLQVECKTDVETGSVFGTL